MRKNKTIKLILFLVLFALAFTHAQESEAVLAQINLANQYWQTNNKPQVRAFWDHAAYHTGNMEIYQLTKNETYRK